MYTTVIYSIIIKDKLINNYNCGKKQKIKRSDSLFTKRLHLHEH
jgi:hypothetical protein